MAECGWLWPPIPMLDLAKVLSYYSLAPPDVRIEPLGAAGGMSGAQFWRIASQGADCGSADSVLILRRWPTQHPTPERLRLIHAVLNHAADRGITFVPVPLTTCDGKSFVELSGHLWELAPWMPGEADYERAPSREKLRAAMSSLAEVHNAVRDYTGPPAAGCGAGLNAIHRRLTRLKKLSHGNLEQFARAVRDDHCPDLAPLARQFLTNLPRALPGAIAQLERLRNAPLPLQPCLRDIWHDHVLFTGEQVTGIVDFGALDIDTPATDIARLLGSLVADNRTAWQAGLAAYAAVRPLSGDELRAAAALDTSGVLLAGCNWIQWIYLDQRRFENTEQIVARFHSILDRCQHQITGFLAQ